MNQDNFIIYLLIFFFAFILLILSKAKAPKQREYGVESVTEKGEVVRSYSEKRISDYFARNNINYVYEPEVNIEHHSFFNLVSSIHRIGLADFYLPDYDVYVEYWGLVNADDKWTRERYVKRMKKKMAQYYSNDIKFISIYPDNLSNLDWIFRTKLKKVTGFEFTK
jgi:hypothetical protein